MLFSLERRFRVFCASSLLTLWSLLLLGLLELGASGLLLLLSLLLLLLL
jgi:hypothetical protein